MNGGIKERGEKTEDDGKKSKEKQNKVDQWGADFWVA